MENLTDYTKLAEAILNADKELKKSNSWKNNVEWDTDNKGKLTNSIQNYIYFIENCPKYAGKLLFNSYSQQIELDGKLFTDDEWNQLYIDCEREIGLSSSTAMDKVVKSLPVNHSYNPVIEYLKKCGGNWDGVKRADSLFIDLLDVEDTILNRTMTYKWLLAAVKRILYPGCKFDNMLILQGSQGIGKSTICELLSNNFFNAMSIDEIDNKDVIDKMNKSWIMIVDEMDSFNKKEMTKIKTFLSTYKDSARLAYGRTTKEYYRHCVFIGSTNENTFLRDSSSLVERRFWILKCNKTQMDSKIRDYLTQETVNQIWGEVYSKFIENENVYLDLELELQDEFAKTMEQFKTSNEDDGINIIKEILNRTYKLNNKGEFNNMFDFFKQVTGDYKYEDCKGSINKIPTTWLSQLLKKEFKIDRTGRYIGISLKSEWDYKPLRYNKCNQKCISRIESIENKEIEDNFTLPF